MEYRKCIGYPVYEVSEDGKNVYSHVSMSNIKLSPHVVKGVETGYVYATLVWADHNMYLDVPKRIAVHRLVCIAFHGLPPEGKPWVNHKDGVRNNNHKDNLEWTSISENIQHSYTVLGRKSPKSMLGKKHKESSKRLQSLAKKGENHPKFKGWYVVNGRKFTNCTDAGKHYGCSGIQILRILKKGVNKDVYFLDKAKLDAVLANS